MARNGRALATSFFRETASGSHDPQSAVRGTGRRPGARRVPAAAIIDADRLLPAFRDSLLGLGLLAADEISTVSPTYAREIQTPEYGRGLDGVLRARSDRLTGILNGIDVRSVESRDGRGDRVALRRASLPSGAPNKAALRRGGGASRDRDAPLLAVVSRLDPQKGFDIAMPAIRRWAEIGRAIRPARHGRSASRRRYALLELDFPGRASVRLRFDTPYAHRVYAGADTVLIPSRYEPCGLTQMIAMRYGAVPVARRTGGLADTVVDAGDPGGTGLMFDEDSPAPSGTRSSGCSTV